MRTTIVERWYLGPIAAIVALIMCSAMESEHFIATREQHYEAVVQRVYSMAARNDFKSLAKSGFVSGPGLEYLQKLNKLFGPVQTWATHSSDDPSRIRVTRPGLVTEEQLFDYSFDSEFRYTELGVQPTESADYSDSLTSATTREQAIEVARDFIHSHSNGDVKSLGLDAAPRGTDWLVVQYVRKGQSVHRWYVVVPTQLGEVVRYKDLAGYASLADVPAFR